MQWHFVKWLIVNSQQSFLYVNFFETDNYFGMAEFGA